MYQTEWDAKIESELNANHETRLGALVQEKYAIALKYNDVTVEHVPKSLSKMKFLSKTPRRSPRKNNWREKIFARP